MKYIVVSNKNSGSGLSTLELNRLFAGEGIKIADYVPIQKGFEKKLTAHIAAKQTIITIGGDGTVSAVAGLLVGTGATLVPLPGGTLNHFCKDLGVDSDLPTAVKQLKKASVRSIDIASVNDKYFINNSSLGLYPSSLQIRDRLEDSLGKWPSALIGSFRAIINFHHYGLTINNEQLRTPFVFIGNNTYKITDFGATERTSLNEGVITVAIVRATNRRQLFKLFIFALFGKLHSAENFDVFTTDAITIKTSRTKLNISRDGEISTITSPINYKIHPKALNVLV